MGPGVNAETEAFLRLKQSPGLGDRRISALVKEKGSGVAALRAARAQGGLFGPEGDLPPLPRWQVESDWALPMTSPDYPSALLELSDPPPLLFLRGAAQLLRGPAVAIVGARRATEGGRRTAEALGRALAASGITVVSGMAKGIDGAAHRGALSVGGGTVAVLGSGLEVVYPPVHRGLFRELGKEGLLVSEFLPKEPALPHHFPKRNRIIAALARAIIVVEAGEKSGALITVDHGLDLGREILAVPGSLYNPQARGTNALIRDGARLLSGPEAILDELPALVDEAAASCRPQAGNLFGNRSGPEGRPGLPPGLQPLWNVLGTDLRPVDDIAERSGLTSGETLAGLTALELMGRVARGPGMRFRRE